MHYATLYQVRAYLGIQAAHTQDDSRLIRFVNEAVKIIDDYKGRRLDVYYKTRYYDVPQKAYSYIGNYAGASYQQLNYLRLRDDLLAVATLTNGDATVIASASFALQPYDEYPKRKLMLLGSSGVAWATNSNGDLERAIALAGYWGFHNDYDNAFEDSTDTVRDNPLTAAATTLTVADADRVAPDGSAQCFQAGQMLKIITAAGLVEFLYISAVSNTTNVLTVKRGYNGTTAVAHALGEKVYIYRPMDNIVAACTRLCAWRYRQKDADVFDKTVILGAGIKIIPSMMPPDVVSLLGAPKQEVSD